MAEPSARVKEIVEKVKTLSPDEQKLFREWLDAWIKLTEIEAKIKQVQRGE
jgi:hypothetical protein